jgi:hypothetical protein
MDDKQSEKEDGTRKTGIKADEKERKKERRKRK